MSKGIFGEFVEEFLDDAFGESVDRLVDSLSDEPKNPPQRAPFEKLLAAQLVEEVLTLKALAPWYKAAEARLGRPLLWRLAYASPETLGKLGYDCPEDVAFYQYLVQYTLDTQARRVDGVRLVNYVVLSADLQRKLSRGGEIQISLRGDRSE